MTILPFLGNSRKKRQMMAQEVKEFSELVKDQYTFLMQQLEKVLKDYFDLSSKVKEMHAEIFSCLLYTSSLSHFCDSWNKIHFAPLRPGSIKCGIINDK